MANEQYIGRSYVLEDSAITINREAPRLDFVCYERMGMTAYEDDGVRPIDGDTLKPIQTKEGLKAGMRLLFCNGFGGMWAATVEPDLMNASGESIFVSLAFDAGHPEHGIPAEWVGTCFGNKKALTRINFQ